MFSSETAVRVETVVKAARGANADTVATKAIATIRRDVTKEVDFMVKRISEIENREETVKVDTFFYGCASGRSSDFEFLQSIMTATSPSSISSSEKIKMFRLLVLL